MIEGRALVAGRSRGRLLRLDEPLSFWGGMDPETGRLIDRRHPQFGVRLTGTILLMPSGRGSSSSSSVLAEAIRAGTAPAGILLRETDGIIALGAVVARELYGLSVPVVVLGPGDYDALPSEGTAVVDGDSVELDVAD